MKTRNKGYVNTELGGAMAALVMGLVGLAVGTELGHKIDKKSYGPHITSQAREIVQLDEQIIKLQEKRNIYSDSAQRTLLAYNERKESLLHQPNAVEEYKYMLSVYNPAIQDYPKNGRWANTLGYLAGLVGFIGTTGLLFKLDNY